MFAGRCGSMSIRSLSLWYSAAKPLSPARVVSKSVSVITSIASGGSIPVRSGKTAAMNASRCWRSPVSTLKRS